jgi:hypothetical protein
LFAKGWVNLLGDFLPLHDDRLLEHLTVFCLKVLLSDKIYLKKILFSVNRYVIRVTVEELEVHPSLLEVYAFPLELQL